MLNTSLMFSLSTADVSVQDKNSLVERCEIILTSIASGNRDSFEDQVADKVKADGGKFLNKRIDTSMNSFSKNNSKETNFEYNDDKSRVWIPKSPNFMQSYPEVEKWYLVKYDAISKSKTFTATCTFYLTNNQWYHYHVFPFGY
ncbi:MAG: hypothetical protein VX100_20305 [Pseudomonadota bacterium]|nr:hypothetical protein [Pseudomonadota bacterium]